MKRQEKHQRQGQGKQERPICGNDSGLFSDLLKLGLRLLLEFLDCRLIPR
jgi:hypothetical protein